MAEQVLDGHDVAFPLSGAHGGQLYRVLLLTAVEWIVDGKERVQRLSHLDGAKNVVIVFLLNSDKPMVAFSQLQKELLIIIE
jgi:hypothetical protein